MTHDSVAADAPGNAWAVSSRAKAMTAISSATMKPTSDVTNSVRYAVALGAASDNVIAGGCQRSLPLAAC